MDIKAGIAEAVGHLADDDDFGFAVRLLDSFERHCTEHPITFIVKQVASTREATEAAGYALLQ